MADGSMTGKMNGLGGVLFKLRDAAELSQSEVAAKLPFTASRLSRLESGEIGLDREEAIEIAKTIGTPEAQALALHLERSWSEVPAPSFDHPSAEALWTAEQSLQRLSQLEADPDLKNVFLRQVQSCKQSLFESVDFLRSTEHPIALLGKPGVGKTTAICALAELRDWNEDELNRQMVLKTGSGRTTVCEVQVRAGGEYGLAIEPCTEDEIRAYVVEFCEYLVKKAGGSDVPDDEEESGGISVEMQRVIRNLSGLTQKKKKLPNGKYQYDDPAVELVSRFPNRAELQVEVLARMNLSRRNRTSSVYSSSSGLPATKWLSKAFAEINFGQSAEFSLPRRILVTIPRSEKTAGLLLGSSKLDIRLIDTRGIDEPSVARRDIQANLDDKRSIILLCSGFEDAPDAAVQSVIQRSKSAGLRDALLERGLLLVLPRDGQEAGMLDDVTGEPVADATEGREIRSDQITTTTLTNLGVGDLAVEFLNVRHRSDCQRAQQAVLGAVERVRSLVEKRIENLSATVDHLIRNKANEQARAVFEHAVQPIHAWLRNNETLSGEPDQINNALQEEIEGLRYASSLRASVNRRGDWHNFDYWHALAFGARRNSVSRSKDQLTTLRGIIETQLSDEELGEAHTFLRHFQSIADSAIDEFFIDVQELGEAAFGEDLRDDHGYWRQCQERWGAGPGYKLDINHWTGGWFSNDDRRERHEFIRAEVERRWREMISRLSDHLSSEGDQSGSSEAALAASEEV